MVKADGKKPKKLFLLSLATRANDDAKEDVKTRHRNI
jgi:hypothetical protein